MLVKSVIAGTVLSLMAGGVVYFGTDIEAGELTEKVATKTAEVKAELSDKIMAGGDAHPHDKKSSVNTPSVKTPSGKLIEAKKPTISYSSESKKKAAKIKKAEIATDDAEPQKKWLNQYLKKEKPQTENEDKIETAKEVMEEMGLTPKDASDSDTGTFTIEEELTEEQIEKAEAEGFEKRVLETENIWVEEGSNDTEPKKSTRKMLRDIIKKDRAIIKGKGKDGTEKKVEVKVMSDENGETRIETETIDMGDGKIMKVVKKTVKTDDAHSKDDKKMRIKVMTDKDGKGGLSADTIEGIMVMTVDDDASLTELLKGAKPKDISATVKVVMTQAEKIKMPELRDRAYLDLVSYGLENGDYKVAAKALKKIEQVELRDTARNRIAVAYAKDGNAEDAFGILDNIEVEALRDVMRLQVIEAMIAPDELPEDMQ